MTRQINNLKASWRNVDIIEVREICQGCNRSNCKPFRVVWGENAKARLDFKFSNQI